MLDQSSPISTHLSPKRQGSPKRNTKSPYNKTMSKSKSPNKRALNIQVAPGGNTRNQKSGPFANCQLATPTSVSMLNSFLIKNADQSFDHYYSSMKKRKA